MFPYNPFNGSPNPFNPKAVLNIASLKDSPVFNKASNLCVS